MEVDVSDWITSSSGHHTMYVQIQIITLQNIEIARHNRQKKRKWQTTRAHHLNFLLIHGVEPVYANGVKSSNIVSLQLLNWIDELFVIEQQFIIWILLDNRKILMILIFVIFYFIANRIL